MNLTIGQIKQGLEGMIREYRRSEGDLQRAKVNLSVRNYLAGHVRNEELFQYLFQYYESRKVEGDIKMKLTEFEE